VGVPKTGTTFLQGVLWASRKPLSEHGVLYPGPASAHFWAAQDLTEHLFMGRENRKVPGAWGKLARQARRWPGSAVLSHELFTLATTAHMRRAVADLEPAELHVVLTARDFERQLPAVWQERLKNGGRISFARHFAQTLEKDATRSSEPSGFWRQQDAVRILSQWAEVVPRDRIHVITIPQPGAPRDTLWRRFAEVVGFDADLVDLETVQSRGNVSLRPPQARLLRRMNTELQGALTPAVYRRVVKRYLSESVTGQGGSSTAYGFSTEQRAIARRWSDELRALVETGGFDVVGSPSELISSDAPVGGQRDLDDVPAGEEAQAAVAATAALVRWIADPPETPDRKPLRALAGHLRARG
jgi:hypothetical protein